LRTAADLTAAERAKEVEYAIAIVEEAVEEFIDAPGDLAKLALRTAVANWNVSTESFTFLEGSYIHDLSTVDPRLAAAHRKMEAFAVANGIDLDCTKRPTVAYLRKLENVEKWQASFALLPLLNDLTQSSASTVVQELERWLALAHENRDEMRGWLALVRSATSVLTPHFVEEAEQLTALEKRYLELSPARS
jgi:hypothetical protein